MPAKGRRIHHDERAHMLVGTRKGIFFYESDFDREKWKRTGPHLADQSIPSIAYDHRDGKTVYVATAAGGLFRTRDLGRSWEKVGRGLPGEKLTAVVIGHFSEPGSVWVGLEGGVIAKSRDHGESFQEVQGFRHNPSVSEWWAKGGPPAVVAIVLHPSSPGKIYAAVNIAGVFTSEDGGETWVSCNQGIAASYPEKYQHADVHRDVHCLVSNPAKPERLFVAGTTGVYRTEDGGLTWKDVSDGLKSRVTRALVVSPSRPDDLFVVPLGAGSEPGEPKVDGALAVYRTSDGGDRWDRLEEGLPERINATVHREAMRIDTLDEEGIYLATSDGSIVVSLDEGETWTQIVHGLAPVLALEVITEQQ